MEYVSGIKLRDIFLDNGNWWKLFLKHHHLIRISIIINVLKMLVCKTRLLGYQIFTCPKCKRNIKVKQSCKSRFCSSCGKKTTDNWIKTSYNSLPNTKWQHITFTMPCALWNLFWINRYLMNKLPLLAANIIKQQAKQRGFIPGIYLAIHTFGRDLKRNIHIHLSTTVGGLALSENSWINNSYFYHNTLKKMWRYQVISYLRKEFKKGKLKLPPQLKNIRSYNSFCSWTTQFYNQTWVVHLNKQSKKFKANIEYLGKYLKRPPLGETRIKGYDGKFVTFEYLDHYTDTNQTLTLSATDFIARLIAHIPDKNFRNIRYYGFLANRVRGKLMPIVQNLLNRKKLIKNKVYTSWREMIRGSFGHDPLKCQNCGLLMEFQQIVPPIRDPTIWMHKEIAHGYFPLL